MEVPLSPSNEQTTVACSQARLLLRSPSVPPLLRKKLENFVDDTDEALERLQTDEMPSDLYQRWGTIKSHWERLFSTVEDTTEFIEATTGLAYFFGCFMLVEYGVSSERQKLRELQFYSHYQLSGTESLRVEAAKGLGLTPESSLLEDLFDEKVTHPAEELLIPVDRLVSRIRSAVLDHTLLKDYDTMPNRQPIQRLIHYDKLILRQFIEFEPRCEYFLTAIMPRAEFLLRPNRLSQRPPNFVTGVSLPDWAQSPLL